jgi:enediyne biosynthesis protein E4
MRFNSVRRDAPYLLVLAMLVLVVACHKETAPKTVPTGPISLHDVTGQTGIKFLHDDGSGGKRYIVEPMSAGLALFDYDSDGLIDIYFLNGKPMEGSKRRKPPRNALYRNLGDLRFEDVTETAGLGDMGFGLGVTAGDYNNDGHLDLYLNNFGPNNLYRNNGNGTFSDVTDEAGVGNGDLVGAGACFLDIDNDGDLDLYAANYLEFDYDKHVQRFVDGIPSYPSPRDFQPVPDSLFRNNGDGTFADISQSSGIASVAGTGMGMVCADTDSDGDTDVFVLNDVAENYYFQNDGKGNFEESGLLVGLAYNVYGDENASMGVDCGDFDNDGWLDFFMTSYQGEMPVLYRNLGGGRFEDATQITKAGSTAYPHVNWGNGLIDFDNDGDLDIFIANGHTEDNAEMFDSSSFYRAPNQLFLNQGDGQFVDVSDQCGDGLLPVEASRGSAFDDLDNDGDIDVAILNSRRPPTILRNDTNNGNHWFQLRLIGTESNRDGVGAQVTLVAGDLTRIDEVHSGRSYQSHYGSRLHFGLGPRDRVDRIEIRWPSSAEDVIEDVEADQLLTIREGGTLVE